ncbi:MAG: VWA domain-containing protein [Candidatus Altiarchaeales archaeon]|nr:VWA domain-containing protein [Candidatus Altiarchaeales archaeon]
MSEGSVSNRSEEEFFSQFPTEEAVLKDISEKHYYIDRDLLLDVYFILKDEGTLDFKSTDTLMKDIERSDPSYWESRIKIEERKDYLKDLAQTTYFQGLISLGDTMKGVHKFADAMGKMYANSLRMKAEPITHSSGEAVSGHFTENDLDIIKEFGSKPNSGFLDFLANEPSPEEVAEDETMQEFYDGCGICPYFDATRTDQRNLEQATIKLAQSLPKEAAALYKAFTALVDELGVKKVKQTDVEHEARSKKDTIDDYDKLQDVDMSDMERDDFDLRAANKTLDVKYNVDDEEGTCHLFVLLDVSGSMMGCDVGGRVCRAFAANVVTLSLLNLAFKERYKVHVVPFAGNVDYHRVQHATTKDEALKVIKWLGTVNYDGGGTDVEEAVIYGYDSLQKEPEYRKCDIVLITDGCSPISNRLVDEKPAKTKLRTLIVGDDLNRYGHHSQALRSASDTYYKITWDNMNSKFKVGGSLSGISDPASNDEDKD